MKSTENTRELAQRVLDYIHEHPENHDQKSIQSCGTNMCIAGTTAFILYGHEADVILWSGYTNDQGHRGLEKMATPLGLSDLEMRDLFYGTMNNEQAVQKLKHVIVGEDWM